MFFITLGLVPMAFMDGFIAFLLWIFATVMSPGNYLYGFMLSFRYVFVFAGIAVLLLMLGRPEALRARSRRVNFWILPVLVLGMDSKRTSRGSL